MGVKRTVDITPGTEYFPILFLDVCSVVGCDIWLEDILLIHLDQDGIYSHGTEWDHPDSECGKRK